VIVMNSNNINCRSFSEYAIRISRTDTDYTTSVIAVVNETGALQKSTFNLKGTLPSQLPRLKLYHYLDELVYQFVCELTEVHSSVVNQYAIILCATNKQVVSTQFVDLRCLALSSHGLVEFNIKTNIKANLIQVISKTIANYLNSLFNQKVLSVKEFKLKKKNLGRFNST